MERMSQIGMVELNAIILLGRIQMTSLKLLKAGAQAIQRICGRLHAHRSKQNGCLGCV